MFVKRAGYREVVFTVEHNKSRKSTSYVNLRQKARESIWATNMQIIRMALRMD